MTKAVSVREFRSKVSHFISNLPITLTVYNKPVASVIPYKGEYGKEKTEDNVVSKKDEENLLGRCQAPRCSRSAVEVVHIATPEGDDKDLRLCKVHTTKAKSESGG